MAAGRRDRVKRTGSHSSASFAARGGRPRPASWRSPASSTHATLPRARVTPGNLRRWAALSRGSERSRSTGALHARGGARATGARGRCATGRVPECSSSMWTPRKSVVVVATLMFVAADGRSAAEVQATRREWHAEAGITWPSSYAPATPSMATHWPAMETVRTPTRSTYPDY
jgi:hypothetical protein